jgi:hypothetical protein
MVESWRGEELSWCTFSWMHLDHESVCKYMVTHLQNSAVQIISWINYEAISNGTTIFWRPILFFRSSTVEMGRLNSNQRSIFLRLLPHVAHPPCSHRRHSLAPPLRLTHAAAPRATACHSLSPALALHPALPLSARSSPCPSCAPRRRSLRPAPMLHPAPPPLWHPTPK